MHFLAKKGYLRRAKRMTDAYKRVVRENEKGSSGWDEDNKV